ncbi:MAG: hypothetical protein K8R88_13865 [Armatimonadetes bacterium]|nr:hypothetical protein [Armatimonadota bacterium]
MKSFVAFSLALGMLGVAHGSFELALVCDLNNHEIDRYDPETGTYLGSFGAGTLAGPISIAINQTLGLAYVADQIAGRVNIYNYNTGSFVRSIATGSTYYVSSLSNGNFMASNYGAANTKVYDPVGNLVSTIVTSGMYVEGHAQSSTGQLWFLNGQGTRSLYRGAVGSTSVTNAYNIVGAANLPSNLSCTGNQLAAIDYDGGNAVRLTSWITAGNSVTSEVSTILSPAGSSFGTGTSIGHGGIVYGVLTVGSASTMYRWIPGAGFTTNFALSQTPYANGMALVVAPEPAPTAALVIGLGLLARRRRMPR